METGTYMSRLSLLAVAMLFALVSAVDAFGNDRYGSRPPVLVSPDLSAPWVMQLRRAPAGVTTRVVVRPAPAPQRAVRPRRDGGRVATIAPRAIPSPAPKPAAPAIDPDFLPTTVDYEGPHEAGTIVIDTNERYLYHVREGGKARRYGVGVGKPGFEWAGTHKVTDKKEWPDWRPPAEMIAREKAKGRVLPVHMKGGPANPLGARALYLGSTLYRIHGTNQPWTIGQAVSSGCIRMRNEDVIELYEQVPVGAKVIVI